MQVSLYEDPNRPTNALGQMRNMIAGINVEELIEENKVLKQQIEDLVCLIFFICAWFT